MNVRGGSTILRTPEVSKNYSYSRVWILPFWVVAERESQVQFVQKCALLSCSKTVILVALDGFTFLLKVTFDFLRLSIWPNQVWFFVYSITRSIIFWASEEQLIGSRWFTVYMFNTNESVDQKLKK